MRIGRDRSRGIGSEQLRQFDEAMEGLVAALLTHLGLQRFLSTCHQLWTTSSAFVAFCPAADDLVIILTDDTEEEDIDLVRIPLTNDVLDDLEQTLLPLIRKQRDARVAGQMAIDSFREAQLLVVARAVANGLEDADDLPSLDAPDTTEFDRATEAVLDELRSLVERYPHAD